MRRAKTTPEAITAMRQRIAEREAKRAAREAALQPDPRLRDDLSIGERSLAAALKAGERWEPAFHRRWCSENGESADDPITVRAEMIRAILFVEGAHMEGCEPPQREAEVLASFGLDPERRHLAQALEIDWTTEPTIPERDNVEKELEKVGEFEGLEKERDRNDVKAEKSRRVNSEWTWQLLHRIQNRPRILGDLNFRGGSFPGEILLKGCTLRSIESEAKGSDILFSHTSLGALDLTSCSLGTLFCERLSVQDDLKAPWLDCRTANLFGARIGGVLQFSGARLQPDQGQSLNCSCAEIGADLILNQGFLASKPVTLICARVGGQFDATEGRFESASSESLDCDAINVGTNIFFRRGFIAKATVNLRGAQIGGQLSCIGGRFEAQEGRSLHCNASKIADSVYLHSGFFASSEVNFIRARIGGQLACDGGKFKAQSGIALDCDAATIAADIFLRDGFEATSTVDFVRAQIGGNLWLGGGQFSCGFGNALNLSGAKIGHTLGITSYKNGTRQVAKVSGTLNLRQAHCQVLLDERVDSKGGVKWLDDSSEIILDGFTYNLLGSGAPKDWKARKAWLNRQPQQDQRGNEFKPQPFEQLARVLREMGHDTEARQVGRIKQFRMHLRPSVSWDSRLFRRLILWPTGYGSMPQIPLAVGVMIILFSTCITGTAYRLGYMTPAQPHGALAAISAELGTTPPDVEDCLLADATETVPPFNAAAYVIDAFIPLVDIDQESSWKPAREARCEGRYTALAPLDEINPGWFSVSYEQSGWDRFVAGLARGGWLHFLQWLLMISGFAISALIAASLSGLIRRD